MYLFPHGELEPKGVTEYAVTTESAEILPYPLWACKSAIPKKISVDSLLFNIKNAEISSNFASKFNMNALATVVMESLKRAEPVILFLLALPSTHRLK